MMRIVKHGLSALVFSILLAVVPGLAQNIKPPLSSALEKLLASKASETTEVTLDKKMLAFASKFMNSKDGDEARAQQLIQKLDYVYVRSYEFKKGNQYTAEDLEAIRKQFEGPEWTPMIREHSAEGENTDIYAKMVNGEMQGMAILSAEARELDFVYILGPIRPEDLQHLSGFGIPKGVLAAPKSSTGTSQKTAKTSAKTVTHEGKQ